MCEACLKSMFVETRAAGRGPFSAGREPGAAGRWPWAVFRGPWAVFCGLWARDRGPWAAGRFLLARSTKMREVSRKLRLSRSFLGHVEEAKKINSVVFVLGVPARDDALAQPRCTTSARSV